VDVDQPSNRREALNEGMGRVVGSAELARARVQRG
jgi:hypothetical protein